MRDTMIRGAVVLAVLSGGAWALGSGPEVYRLDVPSVEVELIDAGDGPRTLARRVTVSAKKAHGFSDAELVISPRLVVRLAPGADAAALARDFQMTLHAVRVHGDAEFVILDAGSGAKALRTRAVLIADERTMSVEASALGLYEPAVPAFTDPFFGDQFHLINTGQFGGTPGVDLNVEAAWDLGFDGAGVTIQIVDDGVQYAHPDLDAHYLPGASFDIGDNDPDPKPEGTADFHGTPCAGLALANADSTAGVGVAYNANLSAVRQTFATATVDDLAFAHDYAITVNDVSSNSYSPADSLLLVAPLSGVQKAAIVNAVTNGRADKGVVFFFSAGNGGTFGDDSNFNEYASSRYTAAVTAVTKDGTKPAYTETGCNLLVSAVSSDNVIQLTTTDLLGPQGINGTPDLDVTDLFGGTSAAAPQAAGVAALMLQANPDLSYRDVQQILATTAQQNDPSHPGWTQNDSGLWFNHVYGFGLIDATAAVQAAQSWTPVGPLVTDTVSVRVRPDIPIPDNGFVEIEADFVDTQVGSIEYVEFRVGIDHEHQGDVRIEAISPSGVTSVVSERPNDAGIGYTYVFTSVRHLDDDPEGTWVFRFTDTATGDTGFVTDLRVQIHGTARPVGNLCSADFDNDGDVDLGDFGVFGAAFGSSTGDANFNPAADFDADGDVDLGDFGVFGSQFGRTDCL